MRTKTNYNVLADCKGMYEQEIIDTILENRGINDVEHFLNLKKQEEKEPVEVFDYDWFDEDDEE